MLRLEGVLDGSGPSLHATAPRGLRMWKRGDATGGKQSECAGGEVSSIGAGAAHDKALGRGHACTKDSARVTGDALGRAKEAKALRERYGLAGPDK
jgi:hypothetical protein